MQFHAILDRFFVFSLYHHAGPDKGAHYHELFLRGKRHLAHRIPRIKIKGKGARKPANPEQEPNFYEKTFLPPTPPKGQKTSCQPTTLEGALLSQRPTAQVALVTTFVPPSQATRLPNSVYQVPPTLPLGVSIVHPVFGNHPLLRGALQYPMTYPQAPAPIATIILPHQVPPSANSTQELHDASR